MIAPTVSGVPRGANKKRHSQRAWQQAKIVNTLRAAAGGWVSSSELIDAMCASSPHRLSRVTLCVLVGRLRTRGFPIAAALTRGYRYAPELWRPIADEPAQGPADASKLALVGLRP